MSLAVAKPLRVQNLGSHKASTFDVEQFFATLVRGLESHGIERGIHDQIELRSRGSAGAVHTNAAFKKQGSSVFGRKGDDRAKRARHISNFNQGLEHSSQ